jgi:hypothetical protein
MLKIVQLHGALSNDGWEEKIFKKLEATGILGQVFRCYTPPSTTRRYGRTISGLLDAVAVFCARQKETQAGSAHGRYSDVTSV